MSWTETLQWTLVREDGSTAEGTLPLRDAPVVSADHRETSTYDTRRIAIAGPQPLGTHRLALSVDAYARATVHVVVVPGARVRAAGPHVGDRAADLHAALRAQRRDRRLRRPARGLPAARRARRELRRHQPAARDVSRRSRGGEPVCGVVAPLAELAVHRARRRSRGERRARARDPRATGARRRARALARGGVTSTTPASRP